MSSLRVASIRVENVKRQLRLDEVIWRRAVPEGIMVAASEMVPAYVEMAVPRKTGELQRSANVRISATRLHLWFEAPYARYVDEGFPESPGRYVPEPLEKRLISTEITIRRDVRNAAIRMGYSTDAADHALTTPIKRVARKELPPHVAGRFAVQAEAPELKKGAKKRRQGVVLVDREMSKEDQDRTIRHELGHAVSWAAKESFTPRQVAATERKAREIEQKAERDIGVHPGYTGAHFSQEIADMLKEDLKTIIEIIITREWGVAF